MGKVIFKYVFVHQEIDETGPAAEKERPQIEKYDIPYKILWA